MWAGSKERRKSRTSAARDRGRQAQQDPVHVQFNPDSGPVPGGYQDREHAAECLVCLVAGTNVADHAIVDVLERYEPVGGIVHRFFSISERMRATNAMLSFSPVYFAVVCSRRIAPTSQATGNGTGICSPSHEGSSPIAFFAGSTVRLPHPSPAPARAGPW